MPGSRILAIREGEDEDLESILPNDVDVLHLWSTPRSAPRRPFLVTIEGNGQEGETFHPNTAFISRKHAENHGATEFVYNGLDTTAFEYDLERKDYAVFLAKASWSVKNLEGAIAIARAAKLRLEVLGSRDWPLGLQRRLPAIRGVKYRGMVGDAEKREVLRAARALLFPVRWHEPFGIAITEALASGCPVFGTPYGSLPEIVTPEVGVLSANGQELANALRSADKYDPSKCRARAQAFDAAVMARAYLPLYERVRRGEKLHSAAPRTKSIAGLSSKNLLPWTSVK